MGYSIIGCQTGSDKGVELHQGSARSVRGPVQADWRSVVVRSLRTGWLLVGANCSLKILGKFRNYLVRLFADQGLSEVANASEDLGVGFHLHVCAAGLRVGVGEQQCQGGLNATPGSPIRCLSSHRGAVGDLIPLRNVDVSTQG